MSQVLQLQIHHRIQDDNGLHVVDDKRAFYIESLDISTTAEGYTAIINDEAITLQSGDQLITKEFDITVNIKHPSQPELAYHQPRSPTRTISEQFEQAGLEPFMQHTQLSDNLFSPNSEHTDQLDPLGFLMGQQQRASTATSLIPQQATLPDLHNHFDHANLTNHSRSYKIDATLANDFNNARPSALLSIEPDLSQSNTTNKTNQPDSINQLLDNYGDQSDAVVLTNHKDMNKKWFERFS